MYKAQKLQTTNDKKKKQKRETKSEQNGWQKDISQSGYYGQEEQYPNWLGWMCELW